VDVDRLTNKTDGFLDIAHAWREESRADVVVLVVNDPFGINEGLSKQVNATATTAFAVVTDGYAMEGSPHFVLAHEAGHLFGACHDRFTGGTCPYTNGRGYIAPSGAWRTIMAYPDPCNFCAAVPYWSNPNITYTDGLPMGTTTYENDASVLQANRLKLRDFRTLPPPSGFTNTNPRTAGAQPNFTWNAVPGVTGYRITRCAVAGVGCGDSGFSFIGPYFITTSFTDSRATMAGPNEACSTTGYYRIISESSHGLSTYANTVSVCLRAAF
jgi:hypothetical protein